MNDTLKWTLIGVGAYLLYQQYAATPAAIAATPAGTPVTPQPTPATAPATTVVTTPAAQQQAQRNLAIVNANGPAAILKAAGKLDQGYGQLYTASQWNYYLPALGVTDQPDLSNYGMDLTTPVNALQWYTALRAYYTAAAASPTGLGRIPATAKKSPLIPVTFDLQQTGW